MRHVTLKADLHLHTSEGDAFIAYDARSLIDRAARAGRLANETGLPLLGTSDSHLVRQFGTTWSLIEAEPTVTSVLAAIRKGQVQEVSQPLTLRKMVPIAIELLLGWQGNRRKRWFASLRGRRRLRDLAARLRPAQASRGSLKVHRARAGKDDIL